jgi:N-acetylneuraminate synthase
LTDDPTRPGPDHAFAMTPAKWREMVDRTRELEAALGDGIKRVEENERETLVVQRRALRAARPLARGTTINRGDLIPLRPWTPRSMGAEHAQEVVGRRVARDVAEGVALHWSDIEE